MEKWPEKKEEEEETLTDFWIRNIYKSFIHPIYLFIQIRQKEAYNNSNINKKNSYIQHILRINIRWPINGLCVFHIKRYLKLCLSCKFFFSLFIHSFAAILRGVKSQDTNYKITDDGDGSKFSQRTNGRSPSCKKLMWIK